MFKEGAMIASLVHHNSKVPKKILAACTLDVRDAKILFSSFKKEACFPNCSLNCFKINHKYPANESMIK